MKDITISRRSLLVSAGLLALAPLAGCGGNSGSGSAAAGSDYTIGVLQLTEHSALDAANDGFVKAIKESGLKVKIDQKNAQNDQSTCKSIADKFVGDNVNLIYAIATPASQVGQICKENKLPFVTGEEGMCMAGGLFTLSINYEDLGYAAGEMAVKILKGEAKPEDMPIKHLSSKDLVVVKNDEMAEALGIDLSALDA